MNQQDFTNYAISKLIEELPFINEWSFLKDGDIIYMELHAFRLVKTPTDSRNVKK